MGLLRYRNKPVACTARLIRQRCYTVASLDVEKLQSEQRGARLLRSESVGTMKCLDTFQPGRNEVVKERRMSDPSRVASDEIFTQQRNQLFVTVQIENAPGAKGIQGKTELPKSNTELGRSRRHIGGKIVRSSSLNGSSYASLTECHHNATKRKNEPKDRTTFDELQLTNEKEFRIIVTRKQNYSRLKFEHHKIF